MGEDVTDANLVYENTLDNNTWAMKVVRLKPYVGTLTVTNVESGEVIYNQNVGIAYDAAFGPDIDDVAAWQDITLEAVEANDAPST